MRKAIELAQIDAETFAPMQEVSMCDPSFGFDPLSLAQEEKKKEQAKEAQPQPAPKPAPNPTPAAAMNVQRLNNIMAALKKIKEISKKPTLPAAFHQMHKGQKHKV